MTDIRWQLSAYVFASIVLWLVAAQLSRRRASSSWIRLLGTGWAASVLRFGYYVGLPYAALILGVVPGRYLGLVGLDQLYARRSSSLEPGPSSDAWQPLLKIQSDISLFILDWLPDVGKMAGLAAVMLLLLSASWLGYSHFRNRMVSGLGINLTTFWNRHDLRGRRVFYQGVHWSFYRSAVWLLTDDIYLGVIGGILLVMGEWLLDPDWVDITREALSREGFLLDVSLLIATSLIFLFVPNLWLLLPVHWVLAVVSTRMMALGGWRLAGSQ